MSIAWHNVVAIANHFMLTEYVPTSQCDHFPLKLSSWPLKGTSTACPRSNGINGSLFMAASCIEVELRVRVGGVATAASGAHPIKSFGFSIYRHENCVDLLVSLLYLLLLTSFGCLFFLFLLWPILDVLNRQLVEMFLTSQGFEHLTSTLE